MIKDVLMIYVNFIIVSEGKNGRNQLAQPTNALSRVQ